VATLKPVVDQLDFLADQGFRRAGGAWRREDALLRGVTVSQHQSLDDAVSFFVTFDLGIPGLSVLGARTSQHVVRCAGDGFARAVLGLTDSFELHKTGGDEELLAGVRRTAEAVCDQFLLRYSNEQELFEMVYTAAKEFLSRGLASSDEITRLQLSPWNVMKRLELAGVFAAFLGRRAEAAEVVRLAQAHAAGRNAGLDYLLPELVANVDSAAALRDHRC